MKKKKWIEKLIIRNHKQAKTIKHLEFSAYDIEKSINSIVEKVDCIGEIVKTSNDVNITVRIEVREIIKKIKKIKDGVTLPF